MYILIPSLLLDVLLLTSFAFFPFSSLCLDFPASMDHSQTKINPFPLICSYQEISSQYEKQKYDNPS